MKDEILKQAIVVLSEKMIPIHDKIEKYRWTHREEARNYGPGFNKNNVLKDDFRNILDHDLFLAKVVPYNMREVLCVCYQDR